MLLILFPSFRQTQEPASSTLRSRRLREQVDVMDMRLDLSESALTFPLLTSREYHNPPPLQKVQEMREQSGETSLVQCRSTSSPTLLYINTAFFSQLIPGNTKVSVSSTVTWDFTQPKQYKSYISRLYIKYEKRNMQKSLQPRTKIWDQISGSDMETKLNPFVESTQELTQALYLSVIFLVCVLLQYISAEICFTLLHLFYSYHCTRSD